MNRKTKILKDKLKNRSLTFGSWITIGHPIIAEVMCRSGFEWLYRIFSDPRRLLRRYVYVVPMFIILLIAEKVKLYKIK